MTRERKRSKTEKGINKKQKISEELQAVINVELASRPEVVKKLWEYIKANDLQNPKNKRNILCDEKLREVMGKDEVTMFEMNSLISDHLS